MKDNIELKNKKIFITGAAGFIGANLIHTLLKQNECYEIVGFDNINNYYDINLKKYRLSQLNSQSNISKTKWTFILGDLKDKNILNTLFEKYHFDLVINLAAQAGVRYSIDHPDSYIESNIIGFYNILETCRHHNISHLIYASSSSVYGDNKKIPYSIKDSVDHPISLYAATKKSNELLAYTYSKLYNIPTTGLRFFTVYGPAGRPDMAYFSFTNKLINNEKIQIYNYGNCSRDFTYIDDIIYGIIQILKKEPKNNNINECIEPPASIYNIGRGKPVNLMDFITILSKELVNIKLLPNDFDINSNIELIPMQQGDMAITFADTTELERDFNYKPKIDLNEGLKHFVHWYKEYYQK